MEQNSRKTNMMALLMSRSKVIDHWIVERENRTEKARGRMVRVEKELGSCSGLFHHFLRYRDKAKRGWEKLAATINDLNAKRKKRGVES